MHSFDWESITVASVIYKNWDWGWPVWVEYKSAIIARFGAKPFDDLLLN